MNNQERIDQIKPQAPEALVTPDGTEREYKSVECMRCGRASVNVAMFSNRGKGWFGICSHCGTELYMLNRVADSREHTVPTPKETAPEAEASQLDLFSIKVDIKDHGVFNNLTIAPITPEALRLDGWGESTEARWAEAGADVYTKGLGDGFFVFVTIGNDGQFDFVELYACDNSGDSFAGNEELNIQTMAQLKQFCAAFLGQQATEPTAAPVTEAKKPESIQVSGNDWIEIELGGGIPINQLFEVQIEGGDIVRAFAHYIIPDGIGPRWWGYAPDGGFVIKGKVTHYARPRLGPHDSPPVTEATEATEAAPLPSEAESDASHCEAFGPMHVDQSPPINGQAVSFYDEKWGVWIQGWYGGLMFITINKKGKVKLYSSDRVKRWQAPNGPPPAEAKNVNPHT